MRTYSTMWLAVLPLLLVVSHSATAGDVTTSDTNMARGAPDCGPGECLVDGVCVKSEDAPCCDENQGCGDSSQPASVAPGVGNPIDMRNGNKFHREVIFSGAGEMPLEFELFYNSKHFTTTTSPVKVIGQWTHTYWSHLKIPTNLGLGSGTVEIRHEDGQSLFFKEPNPAAAGYFSNVDPGSYGFFRATGYNSTTKKYTGYEYERKDGRFETYNSAGLLVEIRARQGGKFTLTRVASGTNTIVTVTRSLGGSMSFTHPTAGGSDDSCFQCPVSFTSPAPDNQVFTFSTITVPTTSRKVIEKITYPSDPTDPPPGGPHVLTFKYELTTAIGSHCPNTWDCRTALTGIVDEEGRRYATYGYTGYLPLIFGTANYRHMAWAYLSYHGTAAQMEDHVQFSQLQISPTTEDPRSWDDKFIATKNFGVKQVYNVDHSISYTGLPSEGILPRISSVRDIRYWDPTQPNPVNVELVNQIYARWDAPGTKKHGMIKDVLIRNNDGQMQGRKKVSYDYHEDVDLNNVADQLVSRKIEIGGPAATETQYRVTDYQWNMLVREPSQILVSRDGTPATQDHRTDFTYTPERRLDTVTVTDLTTHTVPYPTNGRVRITDYDYTYHDAAKTKIQTVTVNGPRTDVSDITTYTYTSDGYLTSILDAAGNLTQWTNHNGRGQPQLRIDPDGAQTTYAYNPRGWLRTQTRDGKTWQYRYFGNGLLKRIDYPNSDFLAYEYNEARKLIQISNSFGDKIIHARTFETNAGVRTGVLSIVTTLKKMIGGTETTVGTETARYDSLGRLFEEIGANGQKTTRIYENGTRLKQVLRDGYGPTNEQLVSTFVYDGLDRVASISHPKAAADPPVVETFEYNVRDGVTKVTDARALETLYTRDGFGELIRLISPDSGTVDYAYDPAGNLLTEVQDLGAGTTTIRVRTYDSANRKISENSLPDNKNFYWTYDSVDNGVFKKRRGRLAYVVDPSGMQEYGYDAMGRVQYLANTVHSSSGPWVFNLGYTYDAVGNPTFISYPSGRTISYPRTGGRITSVGLVPSLGAPSIGVGSGIDYYAFSKGPVRNVTYGNGLALFRERDQTQRLLNYTISGGGTQIFNRAYAYDKFDQVSLIDDLLAPGNDQSFAYDRRNRLDTATGTIYGAYDYDYDIGGNRTSRRFTPPGLAQVVETYSVASASNRLNSIAINDPNPGGGSFTRSFLHDNRGNVYSDVRSPAETIGFTYDDRNKLSMSAKTTSSGTTTETYAYNAWHQRVRSSSAGSESLFVYGLNGELLAETTGSGGLVSEHFYLEGEPFVQVYGNGTSQTYYVHNSHLGTPEVLTDASKTIAWKVDSEPFGQTVQTTGAVGQRLRFPGQYADLGTKVSYNWHRYYDPSIGRYISADPVGQASGVNIFAYAGNNSLAEIDPFGLSSWRPVPGKSGWRVRHDSPHYSGDRYHDHYEKRGKEIARKVDNETGEQKPHGDGVDQDVPEDVVDSGKNAFSGLDPDPTGEAAAFCARYPGVCALAGAGGCYGVYRGLRMIPSLVAPPLWPTIPANAVLP